MGLSQEFINSNDSIKNISFNFKGLEDLENVVSGKKKKNAIIIHEG